MALRSFVVTGGGQGVGRAIAERLVADGHVVVLDLADTLTWADPDVTLVSGDAGDPDTTRRAAEVAEARAPLAGWVNNAAVSMYGRMTELSIQDMRRQMDVNYWGQVYGSLAAVRHLRRDGGALVVRGVRGAFRDRPESPGHRFVRAHARLDRSLRRLALCARRVGANRHGRRSFAGDARRW